MDMYKQCTFTNIGTILAEFLIIIHNIVPEYSVFIHIIIAECSVY